MCEEVKCHLRGIPCVHVIYCQQVGIIEDEDELVFEVCVNHPALIIYPTLLLVLSEEAIILHGRFT